MMAFSSMTMATKCLLLHVNATTALYSSTEDSCASSKVRFVRCISPPQDIPPRPSRAHRSTFIITKCRETIRMAGEVPLPTKFSASYRLTTSYPLLEILLDKCWFEHVMRIFRFYENLEVLEAAKTRRNSTLNKARLSKSLKARQSSELRVPSLARLC